METPTPIGGTGFISKEHLLNQLADSWPQVLLRTG